MTKRYLLIVACAALLLQACAGNKDKSLEPVELVPVNNIAKVSRLWSAKLGSDAEHLRLGLRPASDGSRVFAAAHNGDVSGFDLLTGNRDWRVESGLPLSAGPGFGNGFIVLGSSEGDVVAYEAVDGLQRWRTKVRGEILAAPVIGDGIVVVRTVDGHLIALNAMDGTELWNYAQSVPRLSLRGNSQPAIGGDRVVSGFDNGRLVALVLADGSEVWSVPLATQRGRSELERLADIDSNIVILGDEIYAAGFQSRAALINLRDGQAAWAEELSSAGGLAVDWTGVYTTGGDGVVYALSRESGARQWQSDSMARRGLTGPTAYGQSVVVGDFEGYLHWLSTTDGTTVARIRVGKTRIVSAPLAVGDRLFVQDESGTLYAVSMPLAEAG